jgi:hypothetical protein
MSAAREIALTLAGGRAQRLTDGSFLIPCPVPSHGRGRGDQSPSLRIADGQTRLLIHCYAGCDPRDVLDVLRRRGLLDECPTGPAARAEPRVKAPEDRAREQHRKAAWLWQHRQPVGEIYLRSRGINCPLPATLGYLAPTKPGHHPALIACFHLPEEVEPGRLVTTPHIEAVHLTFLKPDGSGKANVSPNKIMVGGSLGLPIVFAPLNDLFGLAVCEGVENGLTILQATGLGVWCAASAGHMPALADTIPHDVEAITIYADDDKPGRKGAIDLAEGLYARCKRPGGFLRGEIEIIIEGLP